MMRYAILSMLTILSISSPAVNYDVTMCLRVPRVYDNAHSLGQRKYQVQHLDGIVSLGSGGIESLSLTNRTYRVFGRRVEYFCKAKNVQWHLIGNNATGLFAKPSINFSIVASPCYPEGFLPTDDETLILTLSGAGSSNRISGYVVGTLGGGCYWCGNTSPTRDYFTLENVDNAAVFGRFSMRRKK